MFALAAISFRFDALTAFGLLAVSLMLIFYALEERSHWCVLAFAASCLMGSIYGFLQGAWPFGLVEAIWSVIALRRWKLARIRARLAARRWRIDDDDNNGGGGRGPKKPDPGGSNPKLKLSTHWLTERI
jgi:hypothetical protein